MPPAVQDLRNQAQREQRLKARREWADAIKTGPGLKQLPKPNK